MSTLLVFSDPRYVVVAAAIFVGMTIPLLIISEYVFLEPYVVAHLPGGTELGFVLILALSTLSGLVISMNIYRIHLLRGPAGFAIISTFGSLGASASAFLTNYEIPIRLAAIGILGVSWWTTSRSLRSECQI